MVYTEGMQVSWSERVFWMTSNTVYTSCVRASSCWLKQKDRKAELGDFDVETQFVWRQMWS